jgi:hypothetical protein
MNRIVRPPVDLLTHTQFKSVALPPFDEALRPLGFERYASMNWVHHAGPIRRMFSLQEWQGGAVAPRWGFSLDFVPHQRAKQ